MANEQQNGGVEVDRDDNGRSDIQPQQQGDMNGGQQVGGTSPSDMEAPGGSSGSGGYGNAENQQHHQGTGQASYGNSGEIGQSRGEKFDEAQGGGRAPQDATAQQQDQAQHQDRGQSSIEE